MRALFLAVLALAPLTASAARQKIAVLDVRAVQGVQPGTATILTAILVDDAARAGFDAISQADVSAMIGFEKQKKMLGCSEDSSCLAEIGGALGVEYVLSGQVGQIGSRYHLSFQLLDARKARVVGRAARFSDRDEDALAAAAQAAVAELLGNVVASQKVAGAPPAAAKDFAVKESAPKPAPQVAKAPAAKAQAAKPDLAVRAPSATATAEVRGKPFRPGKTLAWATLGGGAALLAVGAVFGVQANAKRDELAGAWQDPDYASLYDQKSGDAKGFATIANVCYGLGAVTTGLGGWLVWKNRAAPLAVAPLAGDGQVGLAASGSF